jgi:hypothetical protein
VWTGSGAAVEGPLEGRRLSFVPSMVTNWHAWSGYQRGCEIADLREVAGR